MSYQYSSFPNKEDFSDWAYFENINNIDKDNIIANREYLVADNKRLSAQFANIVLDAIRAIERFVQELSNKKPNMSDVTGTLPIAHGGTGATTAVNALKNFGITATAKELNYVSEATSNIQTQLNNKADKDHNHNNQYIRYDGVNIGDIQINNPISKNMYNFGINAIKTMTVTANQTVLATQKFKIQDAINDHTIYTIKSETESSSGQKRLDFFKIDGSDSLIKIAFNPIASSGVMSAGGAIDISGDVNIDSYNKLFVHHIESDGALSAVNKKDFTLISSGNICLQQKDDATDNINAELIIKRVYPNHKGGTLVFTRKNRDVLIIGEKNESDGSPTYNQFRFDGDEFKTVVSGREVIVIKENTVKFAGDDSGKCKIELVDGQIAVTPIRFSQVGFTSDHEAYLKSNTLQKITHDILTRLDALEGNAGGGSCGCEAITEDELNAMFEEIGL